ncbi:lysophospholipid acyltransferase 7 [Drosophila grimshawi]|uniref:Lysophospholipid acyltransferase 7 n=1 Tax=Drosophila grimshawi TaxID=7222 RepID=B4JDZ8_DROGR|nr:lysophospholipid acyltransferase 7 [Drosophila grimshawi]EDW03518.1 GH10461 [Drosophila grimshawi]
MSLDDVIYVLCLLACIGAGSYVKKIRDETQRKCICSMLGIVVVVIVSGFHSIHCVISLGLGAASVLLVHPSKCHLVTFGIMFGYLVFFRLVHLFGLPSVPGHTNMIQMLLTLKVSGIAFEKTAAWKRIRARENQDKNAERDVNTEESIEITEYDVELQLLTVTEIIHYSVNYVGILTGPYFRYRTYRDYFEMPFKDHAPCVQATIEQLKWAAFYCSLYLATNYFWPLDYALSDEFYNDRSVLYRLLYVWPTFFIFRARIYTGLTLSECVCTMSGFGAYPDEADVANGEGPRKRYQHMEWDAEKRTYNFTTIVNTRVWDVERCWTFREGMKHWNVCVQYWLAVNVYKLFPIRKYRTGATFLCSAYWHGFRPGHYFCIMGAPLYVPLEDMWHKLVRKDAVGMQRNVLDVIFWISKWFAFSYLGTAFLLSSFDNIWRFYSSVYHFGYIAWVLMVALGVLLTKQKKAAERREKRAPDSIASTGDASATKLKAQ